MKPVILLVDDEPATQFGFERYLSRAGYKLLSAGSLAEAKSLLLSNRFDAVLLDLKLPDGNGLDWIPELRQAHPHLPIVIITGEGDIPVAVESMRRGADDFLTKPVNMADLEVFLGKSLELGSLRLRHSVSQRLLKKESLHFGSSNQMRKVQELATIAAGNDTIILLQGETGTGKGMLAQWIHDKSRRNGSAFVGVNCSNLKGELLASELFGHTRGAFTSAVEDRQGLIDIADGGTLFLDEISDMDPGVQSQILKLIEEKRYRRLGDVKLRRSEFRLICASNRDLQQEMHQGRFRKDLFFRIHIFPITIPPLREHIEDITLFIHHFFTLFGHSRGVTDETLQILKAYEWPGNIREVRNILERAVLLSRGEMIEVRHLPGLASVEGEVDNENRKLKMIEATYVGEMMERFQGDVQKVCKTLGISRATLYRRLNRLKRD